MRFIYSILKCNNSNKIIVYIRKDVSLSCRFRKFFRSGYDPKINNLEKGMNILQNKLEQFV